MKPTTTTMNRIRRLTAIAAAMVMWGSPLADAGDSDGCEPGWAEGVFPVNTGFSGLSGGVNDFVEFDDGNGTRVYAGGSFASASRAGEPLNGVAYWDGEHWQPLRNKDGSSGVDGSVHAMAVYDDGSGPALFVAGEFSSAGGKPAANIARWDGESWMPLAQGVNGLVRTLEVHEFGDGVVELVAGGDFDSASGIESTSHIARWNGQSWGAMLRGFPYGGLTGPVYALKSFDDGSGLKLFATGAFIEFQPDILIGAARWDGEGWLRAGVGLGSGTDSSVAHCLHIHDDGSGPSLYAGGNFWGSRSINRWNGTQWVVVESVLQGRDRKVYALGSLTIGTDSLLIAGGSFTEIEGLEISGLAAWDGEAWAPIPSKILPEGFLAIRAICSPSTSDVAELMVGGNFANSVLRATGVAFWDAGEWISNELLAGLTGPVFELVPSDYFGALAVFGAFDRADAIEVVGAAVYSEGNWEPVAQPFEKLIGPVLKGEGIGGAALFGYRPVNPEQAVSLYDYAAWDGAAWNPIGMEQIFSSNKLPGDLIRTATVYNDGSGPALYLGGEYLVLADDPLTIYPVFRWDGSELTTPEVVPNQDDQLPFYESVVALEVADLGEGPVLLAGALFPSGIWQWDGQSSERINGGLPDSFWDESWVTSIALAGEEVFVSVDRTNAVTYEIDSLILTLDSGQFVNVDYPRPPMHPLGPPPIDRLITVPEPDGPRLYAIQNIDSPQEPFMTGARLLRYNGTNWSVVASEVNGQIYAVTAHDDGTGPALYIGGDFTEVDGVPSGFMAKRPFCGDQPCPADVTGDGAIDLADLNTVLASFGQATNIGDTNGDGTVDLDDLNTVLGAFGAVCK